NPRRLLKIHVQVVDKQEEHTARRIVGRTRDRQNDSFLNWRRRRRERVVGAAAVDQHHRRQLLLDAILEDVEVARLQIGDELIVFRSADDDVGRDELGRRTERRRLLLLLLLWLLRLRLLRAGL